MSGRLGGRPPKRFKIFGLGPFSYRELEEISGVRSFTIKNRINDGFTPEEAVIYRGPGFPEGELPRRPYGSRVQRPDAGDG